MDNGKKYRPSVRGPHPSIDITIIVDDKGQVQLQCLYPVDFPALDIAMLLDTAKNNLLAQLYAKNGEVNKITIKDLQKPNTLLMPNTGDKIIH